jgi:membrane-associated phospholipid phosphatase
LPVPPFRSAQVTPGKPAATLAHAASIGWMASAWQRMRHFLWLKAIGITLFCWVFFIAYFHLLRHPQSAPLQMPLTALDHAIGLNPLALGPYLSLWFYVGLPVVLQANLRHAVVYGGWAGALCMAGLACFYFVPTAIPPLLQDLDVAAHPGFSMLQGVDAAGNACPSLHVATALFSAWWVDWLLRDLGAPAWPRAVNGVWFALICYSTLAVKQHVALDVLAGLVLGAAFAAASLRWRIRLRVHSRQGVPSSERL